MPTFRGIDEFDHVYKAAAVARGQWTSSGEPEHGRGWLVTIPGDIVAAASAVCNSYDYTGHDNCHPAEVLAGGQVRVATAAARYNPVYYLVVGTIARPFHGDAADYAMRVVTALLCALMLAWAAAIVAGWATTRWPLLVFSLGCTPVLVYSTAIASPNGITYSGAALLWAAVAGLVTCRPGASRRFALPVTVGAVAMVTTHTTGIMWVALILAVAALLRPAREWWDIVLQDRRTWVAATLVVCLVTVLCLLWIVLLRTNAPGEVQDLDPLTPGDYVTMNALWLLQAVAVFPTLNEPPPTVVYALWGVPLFVMITASIRRGTRRQRVATLGAFALLVVVPTALTTLSYTRLGVAWQGRYSLPLWLGVSSIAGLALSPSVREPRRSTVHLLYAMMASAVAVSTVHVGLHETAHGAADPAAALIPGGFVIVGTLAVIGIVLPMLALVRDGHAIGPTAGRASSTTSEGTLA